MAFLLTISKHFDFAQRQWFSYCITSSLYKYKASNCRVVTSEASCLFRCHGSGIELTDDITFCAVTVAHGNGQIPLGGGCKRWRFISTYWPPIDVAAVLKELFSNSLSRTVIGALATKLGWDESQRTSVIERLHVKNTQWPNGFLWSSAYMYFNSFLDRMMISWRKNRFRITRPVWPTGMWFSLTEGQW